jgi:phosphatidylserine decarboxylase
MKYVKEGRLFLGGALKNIHEVGSILPSSRAVARAMTAPMRRRPAPRRILEVGAGTGPITALIVVAMLPGDALDIYEINPKFTNFLARRFEQEARFLRVAGQTTIYTAGVESIERKPTYDVIISAIPFTAFPPHQVESFFETYRQILQPDGVLTYIEFAFGRAILRMFAKGSEKERLKAVDRVVRRYNRSYQFRHRFVPFNAPPARIRSLRFQG